MRGLPGFLIATATAVVAYMLSNNLGSQAIEYLFGASCKVGLFARECDFAPSTVFHWKSYAALAGTFSVALAASYIWWRKTILHPFVVGLGLMGMLVIIYDGLVASPVIHDNKIINDTMNVLSFVILASFTLTFGIARNAGLRFTKVVGAVVTSYSCKSAAMIAFVALHNHVMGATELYLLYIMYAFGAFTVHIMTVSSLFAAMRPLPEVPPVAEAFVSQKRAREMASLAVDGLRGVAILLVVVYHYVPTQYFTFSLGKPINAVLFTVAGYFFASLLVKHSTALDGSLKSRLGVVGKMLAGRQLRIWPVLFIVVGLFIGLAYVDGGALTGQIKSTWAYDLFYLGNIPKLMYGAEAFPSHLWVVGVQEQWIVFFCLTIVLVGVSGFRRLLWPLVGLGIVTRLAGVVAFMPDHPSWALETPFAVLDALALGMLARFAIEEKVTRGRLRRLTWAAMLISIATWVFLPNVNAAYFTIVPLATALLTAFLIVTLTDEARGQRAYQAFFGNPLLVMLGRMSLSAFLLHPFINTVIRLVYTSYTGVEMPWWLLSVVGPVTSFGVAWVFWRTIETPLRNVRARLKTEAPRAAPAAPAPTPAAEVPSAA